MNALLGGLLYALLWGAGCCALGWLERYWRRVSAPWHAYKLLAARERARRARHG